MSRRVEELLSRLPVDEHCKPVPLLSQGPALVERLLGTRPHKSTLFRHATRGQFGVTLHTIALGNTRYTCAKWLVEFWLEVGEARRKRARRAGG